MSVIITYVKTLKPSNYHSTVIKTQIINYLRIIPIKNTQKYSYYSEIH